MRPRTMAIGNAEPAFGQRFLRFGGADKADRHADDAGRPGCAVAQHVEQVEQRGRCIADSDERTASFSRQSRIAAAERVVPNSLREFRRSRIAQRANDVVARGQASAVTPRETISASHKIGAPRAQLSRRRDEFWRKDEVCAASTRPQAWIIRTATSASASEIATSRPRHE